MEPNELDDLTNRFVSALRDRIPPTLSPATPERLKEVSRAHVEAIGPEAIGKVPPLVGDLLEQLAAKPREGAKEEAKEATKEEVKEAPRQPHRETLKEEATPAPTRPHRPSR